MQTSSVITLAVLAATAMLSLRAEAPCYGVQGLVNIPRSDLKKYVDSKPGPGFGVHGTFDLGDGHMLRPRLDYSLFPEASFATLKQTASSLSLGGDYLYFLAGKPEGIYFTAGLAVARWSLRQRDVPGIPDTTSNTTKFGLVAGVGCQWSATLGTDLRWLHSNLTTNKVSASAQTSQFKADTLQVGVTIRF